MTAKEVPREELHLALFQNFYRIYTPQYTAQNFSSRFVHGARLTTGFADVDERISTQMTSMYLPVINAVASQPSILNIHNAGTYYYFENSYDMLTCFRQLDAYIKAAVDCYTYHPETLSVEIVDALRLLGNLADAFSHRLNEQGFKKEGEQTVLTILNSFIGKQTKNIIDVKSTTYESEVMAMRQRHGLNHGV
jgi:hypothetical protein